MATARREKGIMRRRGEKRDGGDKGGGPTQRRRPTHAAVLRRDDELRDLAAVDAEDVLHLAGENVPDDDGEVHPSGHQGALVVAGRDLVGVQHAGHLVAVPSQGAMGGPAFRRGRENRGVRVRGHRYTATHV